MKLKNLILFGLLFAVNAFGQIEKSASELTPEEFSPSRIHKTLLAEESLPDYRNGNLDNLLISGQKAQSFFLTAENVPSKVFTVNSGGDTSDGAYADGICADESGNCTLRAALEEARSRPGNYFVTFALPLPAVINLTLGELLIARNVTIFGPGAGRLTVRRSAAAGTEDFRIFYVGESENIAARIYGLTIANGRGIVGGGIYNRPISDLTLIDVAVTNNVAAAAGGIVNFGTLTVNRSLINGNRAVPANVPNPLPAIGGGIHNDAGTLTIANSTITDNEAVSGGGFSTFTGTVNLANVTVSHNTATASGGGIYNRSGATVNALNTIIADNNSPDAANAFGAYNSSGNNLIADGSGSTGFINGVNGDQIGTGGAPINPLLGTLADNGGQTKTRALLPGSPAIDRANGCVLSINCPTINLPFPLQTDQRNFRRRPTTAVDVGAFELNAFSPSASVGFLAGIVFEPGGRYAAGAVVRLFSPAGAIMYAVTNPFGRFAFSGIAGGETYLVEIRYKRYNFTPQVLPPF